MGTRNLTAVYKDGDFKVAQYGQWDGYPSGNGLIILRFLREKWDQLKDVIDNVRWLDAEKYEKECAEEGFNEDGMLTLHESERFNKRFPLLTRDLGASILEAIVDRGGNVELVNSASFAYDSLFCEWAYCVNFDDKTLEVYSGFTSVDDDYDMGVFAQVDGEAGQDHRGKYGGINKVAVYPLDDLPSDDQFLAGLEETEEEVA